MLFEVMIEQLRTLLMDFEAVDDFGQIVPPQYDDDRLSVLLAISIKQVQTLLRIPKQCRLSPLLEPPYLDPWYDIHDDFAHLVILKALCILQTREIENQYNTGHVKAVLGPATLQTGAATWSGMPRHIWTHTSPCAEFDKLMTTWIAFDPNKFHAVYAVLPRGVGGTADGGRGQGFGDSPATMIQ